jgi:hypothetical protein
MGNVVSQYNPFSVYGEYNLKKTAYENKKSFIAILSFTLLIIIGTITVLYVTGEKPAKPIRTYNIPQPKYGIGPYGYGLYIPPVDLIRQ